MEKQRPSGDLELAGINDAEIAGYLCSGKEIQMRKLMWEILNRDYLKGKRLKKPVKSKKKAPPANKALKLGGSDQKQKKKSVSAASSKINYDALKKLMEKERDEKSTSSQIGEDSETNIGGDYYNDDNADGDDFDF